MSSSGRRVQQPLMVAAVALAVSGGCKRGDPAPAGASSAAAASASSAASAAPVDPPPVTIDGAPQGTGVTEFVAATQTEACKVHSADIGSYLQRGEIALGARAGSIATAWLVPLGSRGSQVAFSGFDGEARQLARARGVAPALDQLPQVFSAGEGWTLAWFDSEGLAYARPRWEMTPGPLIEHLGAMAGSSPDNLAVSVTPTGSLVAAAPFGGDSSRLSLFLFAPVEAGAPPVKALGVTRHAKQPTKPALAANAEGYYLLWHEEGGRIAASHFDPAGKESDEAFTVAAAADPPRERLSVAATAGGAIAMWMEGETILVRALDGQAKPTASPWVVGKGRWASITTAGEGALVAWVGSDKDTPHQLLAARLGKDARPADKGLRVGESVVKDPPALIVAGDRAAFGWTEVMSPIVSTKRAVLRTVELSCVP